MANALYPKGKAKFMRGLIDLQGVTIRAYLLDATTYVYNAAHEFLSDIGAAARVAKTNPLSGKTVNMTTGAFDSDDPTAEAVTGDPITRLVLYIDTGVEATSSLLMFQDTGVTTVPFTPDGSDIRVVIDAAGWFIL
jgi:hypothetical protein